MKILVIDDDAKFAEFLKQEVRLYLTDVIDRISVECITNNFLKIEYEKVDIAFVDIELKECNGIDVALRIRAMYPRVVLVFVSYHDNLIFNTLVTGIFYFVRKSKYELDSQLAFQQLKKYIETYAGKKAITIGGRTYTIEVRDIEYLLSIGNEVVIHTRLGDLIVRGSIVKILEILDFSLLVQIQRNYAISLDYIQSFLKTKVRMLDGTEYKIGRVYKQKFLENYRLYRFKM